METDDIFLIHVQIGGFRIPLRIARKDEEFYRKAEKLLVQYLDKFHQQYPQRATEEVLILVAYQFAVLVSKQEYAKDIKPLADKIKVLDEELKALLGE